jgi:hypothetical protein
MTKESTQDRSKAVCVITMPGIVSFTNRTDNRLIMTILHPHIHPTTK